MCMALYTQGCSMMSTCHSYICMAIAAALHMGIFAEDIDRSEPDDHSSETDDHMANRDAVAAVLFVLDAYITTTLGLPRMLRDTSLMSWFQESTVANDPQHTKYSTFRGAQLACILADILGTVYPEPIRKFSAHKTLSIKRTGVEKIERQLKWWYDQLDSATSTLYQHSNSRNDSFLRQASNVWTSQSVRLTEA
jgi:hypothetical protein